MSRPPVGLVRGPGGRRVALPQPVPLPSLGGQQCGRHGRRSGHGGRGPHTALVRCSVPPLGVVRASLLCAGVGSPACPDLRGSRGQGVRRHRACGSSCAPPRASRSLLGEGGHPLCLGGGGGGAVPPRPAGRGGSGGGGGGGARPSPAPLFQPDGPWPSSLSPWAPPLGIHVQLGLPGSRGRWLQLGWPPAGQCGMGGGGGRSLCRGLPLPAFPRWAPNWAASSAHSWVPPFRRGPRRRRRAPGR